MKADKITLLSLITTHSVSTHSARVVASFKSLRAPVFGWRLMKSKEISCLSLSPWSSVLHTIEDSQSCSLLQSNKSSLKRDILARRRNGRDRLGCDQLASAAPGEWTREPPVPARRHLEQDTQVEKILRGK